MQIDSQSQDGIYDYCTSWSCGLTHKKPMELNTLGKLHRRYDILMLRDLFFYESLNHPLVFSNPHFYLVCSRF